MKKVDEVGHAPPGMKIKAICEHWNTKSKKEVLLIAVDEDDQSYRFQDDNSELSYDWNVIEWEPTEDGD